MAGQALTLLAEFAPGLALVPVSEDIGSSPLRDDDPDIRAVYEASRDDRTWDRIMEQGGGHQLWRRSHHTSPVTVSSR